VRTLSSACDQALLALSTKLSTLLQGASQPVSIQWALEHGQLTYSVFIIISKYADDVVLRWTSWFRRQEPGPRQNAWHSVSNAWSASSRSRPSNSRNRNCYPEQLQCCRRRTVKFVEYKYSGSFGVAPCELRRLGRVLTPVTCAPLPPGKPYSSGVRR
jgi:hypothetical protein